MPVGSGTAAGDPSNWTSEKPVKSGSPQLLPTTNRTWDAVTGVEKLNCSGDRGPPIALANSVGAPGIVEKLDPSVELCTVTPRIPME